MAVGDRLAARLTVGTDGQVLKADSTQASMLNWATVPSLLLTGYRLKRVTVITATGTWIRDADVVAAWVRGWGAGGGSGGADNNAAGELSFTQGAGGGAYCESLLEGLTANETVTIGAGGNAGAATGTAGTAGGDTSFGAHFTAGGGGASAGATTGGTSVAVFAPSDIGGTATGGNIANRAGLPSGIRVRASGTTGVSGEGGSSPNGGGGGRSVAAPSPGAAGRFPGGGASGACSSDTAGEVGGNGANGLIIAFELMR